MVEDTHFHDPASLSRAVAADMTDIFAGLRPVNPAAGESVVRRVSPRRGSRFKPATVGALLAAGLVGVSAGAMLERDDPAVRQAAPVATAAIPPAPTKAPEPVPASQPAPSAPIVQASAPEPAPKVEKAVATRPKPKPKKAKARPTRASRAEVLAADRRLRRAYDRAIRAGVPRPVLVDYRNRWNRLRRTTWNEPAQLVRGYDRLERGLSQEAARFS